MPKLKRFGVSIDENLLAKFDKFIRQKGYDNRSEAIRDIIRKELVKEDVSKSKLSGTGTINIVFDHHKAHLSDRLTDIQHRTSLRIHSTTHIHLDKVHCLEIIVASGEVGKIQKFGEAIGALKGVLQSETFLFTT